MIVQGPGRFWFGGLSPAMGKILAHQHLVHGWFEALVFKPAYSFLDQGQHELVLTLDRRGHHVDPFSGCLPCVHSFAVQGCAQAIVLEGGNAMQIAAVAQKAGIRDLRQSALMKVRNGVTSLAEINRVTKD